MSLLYTLVAFIVAIGALIVFHEYGHYLAARLCNVKVLKFSIGFGRPLYTKRRGPDQTEWILAAFPLGGYVKMLDEHEGDVLPQERPRAFNRQPIAKRFFIVSAGPFANLLLAVLIYWVLFMHGIQGIRPVLGIVPAGSPAAIAGIRSDDTIVRIAGEPVSIWQDVHWKMLELAVSHEYVDVDVQDTLGRVHRYRMDLSMISPEDLDGEFLSKVGLVQPQLPAKIGQVLPDEPAAKAGLQPGDEVVQINNIPLKYWNDFVEWVRHHAGQVLTLEVKRPDGSHVIKVTPDTVKKDGHAEGKIGAAPYFNKQLLDKMLVNVRYSPLDALWQAVVKTWDTSRFSLKMLWKMVTGEVSWKNISGPITIADYAGQTAALGWMAYLSFIALVSISLGVLNLLPIPLLDGGHLMYYTVELVKGAPVSERFMAVGQRIGIAVLMLLMTFAFYNDINRLIGG
jgi:regulator of sigma E protease